MAMTPEQRQERRLARLKGQDAFAAKRAERRAGAPQAQPTAAQTIEDPVQLLTVVRVLLDLAIERLRRE